MTIRIVLCAIFLLGVGCSFGHEYMVGIMNGTSGVLSGAMCCFMDFNRVAAGFRPVRVPATAE
jgi:hypothetical protein